MKHTEESKKKISGTRKKMFASGELKPLNYWLGKKRPIETIKKMSLSKKGWKPNEEWKRKQSIAHTGRKHTPEARARMTEAQRGNKNGLGIKRSMAFRQLLSSQRRGEKGSNWQGGKTEINARIRLHLESRLWREAVFERDNWTCVFCLKKGGWSKEEKRKIILNADHIKGFALFPELRLDVSNGRTLCVDCHRQTENYGGRTLRLQKLQNASH